MITGYWNSGVGADRKGEEKPSVMQGSSETEEYLTCLHVQLYHPKQADGRVYALMPLNRRQKHPAEEPLRLGRDEESCTFILADQRVSRKHLSIQAFRSPRCSELLFQVQNLSRRGFLSVNGARLEYLHWAELPGKALVRFGDHQLLVRREPGDGLGAFEVEFCVSPAPPCQELGGGTGCPAGRPSWTGAASCRRAPRSPPRRPPWRRTRRRTCPEGPPPPGKKASLGAVGCPPERPGLWNRLEHSVQAPPVPLRSSLIPVTVRELRGQPATGK
ncbi:TRAF-interacting protein with FHA domain-containing protein A isoform X1 [Anguilla rostrata]|uniref:TRAF-interacting protein with FHA domain-containing protein A isoform X1 n=2 Tax=Anguilla rostrata TaxID=7938 RepID=UPI0030CF8B5E